ADGMVRVQQELREKKIPRQQAVVVEVPLDRPGAVRREAHLPRAANVAAAEVSGKLTNHVGGDEVADAERQSPAFEPEQRPEADRIPPQVPGRLDGFHFGSAPGSLGNPPFSVPRPAQVTGSPQESGSDPCRTREVAAPCR